MERWRPKKDNIKNNKQDIITVNAIKNKYKGLGKIPAVTSLEMWLALPSKGGATTLPPMESVAVYSIYESDASSTEATIRIIPSKGNIILIHKEIKSEKSNLNGAAPMTPIDAILIGNIFNPRYDTGPSLQFDINEVQAKKCLYTVGSSRRGPSSAVNLVEGSIGDEKATKLV
ncbi:hypothetical protein HAX54_044670 [Datura stramonium]|uniref:Uncharacterized protein n=1 Tax=Datura stramonium TaxID=4076 RepID=A0ABS8SPQ7_DATST|nr:hypothetical protein [Datura stramonium]